MEIKLECGITIDPEHEVYGIDVDLVLTKGWDCFLEATNFTGDFAQLTDADRQQIGTLMIDRWQRFMGVADSLAEPAKSSTLLPCPFCGSSKIDPEGWASNDGTSGPVCDECMASARDIQAWNRRADTAFITFHGGSVSKASGFYAIPKGLTQTPLTTSELAAALDQRPPSEDALRAALRQCAIELEEASKLLRPLAPSIAEMLRIAADRAAKTAKGSANDPL